jgi:glucosamine-6-phosphate deaminase
VRAMRVDGIDVRVYADKAALGAAAAAYAAGVIRETIAGKGAARVVFATGASQFEFLDALVPIEEIDWGNVTAFHLDEYVGIPVTHPASFRKYLRARLFDRVGPGAVHLLAGDAADVQAECDRYASLLAAGPIDLACIGIGENGHIAFNDPPVADFEDPVLVKAVALDEACRRQQLGEGWFPTFEDVPTQALTQTVPAILRAERISCVVPDARKADAVAAALGGPISPACPASALRTHGKTVLWLDEPAAGKSSELRVQS